MHEAPCLPGSGETEVNRHSSCPLGHMIKDRGGDTESVEMQRQRSPERARALVLRPVMGVLTCHAHPDLRTWSFRLYGFQPLAGPSARRPFWSLGLGGVSPVPDDERQCLGWTGPEVLESNRSEFGSQLSGV